MEEIKGRKRWNKDIAYNHHIEGFNKNKDLIYIIDNGVTLCTNCHRKFHKKYGSGDNSLEQFLSFIK